MLHMLILKVKVTKFQLLPPKRLSTVVKNIIGGGGGGGGIMSRPGQIGLRAHTKFSDQQHEDSTLRSKKNVMKHH